MLSFSLVLTEIGLLNNSLESKTYNKRLWLISRTVLNFSTLSKLHYQQFIYVVSLLTSFSLKLDGASGSCNANVNPLDIKVRQSHCQSENLFMGQVSQARNLRVLTQAQSPAVDVSIWLGESRAHRDTKGWRLSPYSECEGMQQSK